VPLVVSFGGRSGVLNYIGIDPGQKGGLAYLANGQITEYTLMPLTVHDVVLWVSDRLHNADGPVSLVAELAQAMPKQGVTSSFNYGRHFGQFEAIAAALGIPYHEVRPAIWKKAMGLNAAKVDSVTLCQRLFPGVDLIPNGCRVAKDGIAEACLIAEWARRQGL